MKKAVLLVCILLMAFGVFSQNNISLDSSVLAAHKGDSVTISGTVFGGAYLKNVKTKPTLLNLGDSMNPKARLTIRIEPEDRDKFSAPPEELFKNKNITVSGVLDEYKGNALMSLANPEMIKIDSQRVSIAGNPFKNVGLNSGVNKTPDTLFQYLPIKRDDEKSKNVRSQLVLRASPQSKAPVIAVLDPGTVIVVPYLTKKWTYVYVKTENGASKIFGFIKTKALKRLKNER
jgi:hypothetical protein